jgi:hypothetical protein
MRWLQKTWLGFPLRGCEVARELSQLRPRPPISYTVFRGKLKSSETHY